MKKVIILFCFIVACQVYGQVEYSSRWKFGIRANIENDRWSFPLNQDRNYTQGFSLSYFNLNIAEAICRKGFLKRKFAGENKIILPLEVTAQFGAFTPDELRDSLPIIGDRPYSTIFLVGAKFTAIDVVKLTASSGGVYIGALGIDGPAEDLQTYIHQKSNKGNTVPPYDPAGWHNQISNGGEPTIMLSFLKTTLLGRKELQERMRSGEKSKGWFQSSLLYGFNLFYLTQASLGINMRVGKLHLANFSNDPFNVLAAPSSFVDKIAVRTNEKIYEAYFFTSLIGSITPYNGSLHGQFRKTAYRLDYRETGFVNAQARIGIGLTLNRVNAAAYLAFKSPEMWNNFSRIHYWGGASLGYSWN